MSPEKSALIRACNDKQSDSAINIANTFLQRFENMSNDSDWEDYLAILDRYRDRDSLWFGFSASSLAHIQEDLRNRFGEGTKERPFVISFDDEKLNSLIRHNLGHIHSQGVCAKNRGGIFCQ